MTEYRNERPWWCPHPTCEHALTAGEHRSCVGRLPAPEPHGPGVNTHRICLHGAKDDGDWTFDLQVNSGDAFHLRRLLDVITLDRRR